MKTLAAVLTKIRAPLEILELTLPDLKPGQVLVKMAFSGICHSQLNEIKGLKGEDAYLPHTLGHEGSGKVIAIGERVTKVKLGDSVVLTWIKGRGMDVPCCTYLQGDRVINSGAISTFLSHAVVSENRVVPIPEEMPLREAALLGCALPTGAGVVKNQMQLQKGQSIAIFGLGGIGLSALIAAKHAGADPIIAVDIHSEKLERASRCGASHSICAAFQNPVEGISHITKKGVDFSFESAGSKKAMEEAFKSLKPGGLCVVAGNLPKGETIAIDPFELILGKRIEGTWGGKSTIDDDISYYVSLILQNMLHLGPLITHAVALPKIDTLLEDLEKGRVGRGLIAF